MNYDVTSGDSLVECAQLSSWGERKLQVNPRPILRAHMPELDSIRGMAILMVFVFHAYAWEAPARKFSGISSSAVQVTMFGRTGVNLFFVLSGFLITGILYESKTRSNYWRRFYTRRALRILPAYYLLLLLLPLAALIPAMPQKVGWKFLGFSFVYLANMSEIFGVNMQYGPLWSLAVEEHFYIGWPWFMRWLKLKWLIVAASCVIIASPIVRAITFRHGGIWNGEVRTWNSLDGLAMGALLALVMRTGLDQRKVARWFAVLALLVAVFSFAAGQSHGIMSQNCDYIGKALRTTVENATFLSVLCSVLLLGTSDFARIVNLGWLQFFGTISYGFYLVHVLVLHLYNAVLGAPRADLGVLTVRALVSLAACTVICWISRRTFEQYFLDLKRKFEGEREHPETKQSPVPAVARGAQTAD